MTKRRPSRWIEELDLDSIRRAPQNPKAHDDALIARSMARFGYVETMTLDDRTGLLVAGHGRLDYLTEQRNAGDPPPEGVRVGAGGAWLVPVQRGWSSASDLEADEYLVVSNQATIAGGWVRTELADLLESIDHRGGDLADVGFSTSSIDELRASLTPVAKRDTDPSLDLAIDVPARPKTRRGDVWLIGDHRVMCGDCRDADDVATLMGDERANLSFTSPPYADRREYDASSGFVPIHPDAYVEWFHPVAANVAAHLADDGSWFVNIKAGANDLDTELYVHDLVLAHVREWGWHYATEFCWERTGVPKRPSRRFKNQFEPVYQFARGEWKMRADHVRHLTENAITTLGHGDTGWDTKQGKGGVIGDDRRTPRNTGGAGALADLQGTPGEEWFNARHVNGWAYPGNRLPTFTGSHEATGHSAAFPVGLPSWFVLAYTDAGDVVYEPFAGSGSTIIAAHQHGRRGRGMEISPGYVDVICERMRRTTGVTAVRERDGFVWKGLGAPKRAK